jgi:hypothetical protein
MGQAMALFRSPLTPPGSAPRWWNKQQRLLLFEDRTDGEILQNQYYGGSNGRHVPQ